LFGWLVTDCILNVATKRLKLLGSVGNPVLSKEEKQGGKKKRTKEKERKKERSLAITTANLPATS